jgi:hypothetical protein
MHFDTMLFDQKRVFNLLISLLGPLLEKAPNVVDLE